MSGCIDCWETPCVCGTGYKHLTVDKLKELIETLNKVLAEKTANPVVDANVVLTSRTIDPDQLQDALNGEMVMRGLGNRFSFAYRPSDDSVVIKDINNKFKGNLKFVTSRKLQLSRQAYNGGEDSVSEAMRGIIFAVVRRVFGAKSPNNF